MTVERTNFLYPFIDAEEDDVPSLLADLASSARSKLSESRNLRASVVGAASEHVERAAAEMCNRFRTGGRLFTFGNGGSSTDAKAAADVFSSSWSAPALPAFCLVEDPAILTALSNDIGFDVVFSRQVIARGEARDVAMGFSTSGDSANVIRALREAASRQMLTIGLSGYEGGAMAVTDEIDFCFVVPSDSVHRIQEAQDAIVSELWTTVRQKLEGTS